MMLTLEVQREFFKGVRYDSERNVAIVGERVMDSARFNAMYGGYAFALDPYCIELTYRPWTALKNAYRRQMLNWP